jgi:hypothetical protein
MGTCREEQQQGGKKGQEGTRRGKKGQQGATENEWLEQAIHSCRALGCMKKMKKRWIVAVPVNRHRVFWQRGFQSNAIVWSI